MEITEMFSDKPPKTQAEILELIDMLRVEPRITITVAAKKMGIAVSTVFDRMRLIGERLTMTTAFEPKASKKPKPVLKCPYCRSADTDPQFIYKEGMGTQVIGLICKACKKTSRRSQLPRLAVTAVEASVVEGSY